MVKITTDSTCDLPQWIIEKYNITVLPLGINKGGVVYKDGIDINIDDIAKHVDEGGEITTTSAVNIAEYLSVFSKYSQQYDDVIHFNIGKGFSSCYQNALFASGEIEKGNIHVFDTSSLCLGHGMLVLLAAEEAERGKSAKEIISELEKKRPLAEASFVLDRLDYMKKGGRCSAVTALGANLLKIHPCIEVTDSKMGVGKRYRGTMEKVIGDYVNDRICNRDDIDYDKIFLVDTCRTPGLVELARKEIEATGKFKQIIQSKAGCTIFCHCGPDTLGVMFFRKEK